MIHASDTRGWPGFRSLIQHLGPSEALELDNRWRLEPEQRQVGTRRETAEAFLLPLSGASASSCVKKQPVLIQKMSSTSRDL